MHTLTATATAMPRTTVHDNTVTSSGCPQVFLPDGKSVLVATANPVGVEGYVQVGGCCVTL